MEAALTLETLDNGIDQSGLIKEIPRYHIFMIFVHALSRFYFQKKETLLDDSTYQAFVFVELFADPSMFDDSVFVQPNGEKMKIPGWAFDDIAKTLRVIAGNYNAVDPPATCAIANKVNGVYNINVFRHAHKIPQPYQPGALTLDEMVKRAFAIVLGSTPWDKAERERKKYYLGFAHYVIAICKREERLAMRICRVTFA